MEQLSEYLTNRGLSLRQREVAELVARGLSNKEIGVQLFLTEKTVKFHLMSVYKIMGVKSRASLIVNCLPYLTYGGLETPNEI